MAALQQLRPVPLQGLGLTVHFDRWSSTHETLLAQCPVGELILRFEGYNPASSDCAVASMCCTRPCDSELTGACKVVGGSVFYTAFQHSPRVIVTKLAYLHCQGLSATSCAVCLSH